MIGACNMLHFIYKQIVLEYSCKFQNVFIRVVEAMPHIRGKKQNGTPKENLD
jgi:hypothetical protein